MHGLIAPFRLGVDEQGDIVEINGKSFDIKAYSRMKYGVRSDLQTFARILTTELAQQAPELFTGTKPPAILTSYKAAAPPATTLARYCLDSINLGRFRAGLAPGEMVQVYRPQDYIQEYAVLPLAERQKLMGSQTGNTLRGRSLEGFLPLILDDIYVTGTYTAMMEQVLQGYDTVITAFLIACDESLRQRPQVEAMLNTSEISNPGDLLPFIANGDFVFTRRFLKMLLRTPPEALQAIAAKLPDTLIEQVARAIIDTDSELQHLFPETCAILLKHADIR